MQKPYMLKWHSSSKLGKIGRARKSKVKFFKKTKPGKDEKVDCLESPTKNNQEGGLDPETVICSYPVDPRSSMANAITLAEFNHLKPKVFMSDINIDTEIHRMKTSLAPGR